MDIIDIRSLTKQFYPSTNIFRALVLSGKPRKCLCALNQVSLQVKEGELFCIFGPNKSGKSTLLKIISSYLLPTKGSVHVCGKDLLKEADHIRNMVNFVQGEERSFYWRLSGRENLYFFGRLYGIPLAKLRKKTEELFTLLEIDDPDALFQEYSSGMKQRLSIARGLLNDPRVILMDEPTKGLDFLIAEKIRSFIRAEIIEKQKRTVLYTTHSLEEAKEIADRMAFIEAGVIKRQYCRHAIKELEGLNNVFTGENKPDS